MEATNEIQIIDGMKVVNTPAVINVNFDELKSALEAQLKKYDIVVTAETLPECKRLAKELNASKKIIDDRRKLEIKKASVNIVEFDSEMKELVIMNAQGRQKLLDQIAKFDDEATRLCADQLAALRHNLWNSNEVSEEFRRADFEDIAKPSNLTPKGVLTKAARTEIEARVARDKADQDLMERRLLQLENECFRAGLKAPLTREHVNHFLIADDHVYQERLGKLIASELKRQVDSEEVLRREIERNERIKAEENQRRINEEQQRVQAQELAEQQRQEAERLAVEAASNPKQETLPVEQEALPTEQVGEPVQEGEPQPLPSNEPVTGIVNKNVSCTFVIKIDAAVSDEDIENEARKMMAKAGITTLSSVTVSLA